MSARGGSNGVTIVWSTAGVPALSVPLRVNRNGRLAAPGPHLTRSPSGTVPCPADCPLPRSGSRVRKVAPDLKNGESVVMMENIMKPGTENSSSLNNLTLGSSTLESTSLDAGTLQTTVTSLPTTDLNECTKNPCQHGICVNQDGGYKCTCSHGWTGQNCQEDINECAKQPCQHGRCVNQDGGYKCTCSDGWTGKNCHEDINECYRNPCQHGRCENNGARRCKSGWSEYNNNCYKLFKNMVSWPTANSKCKQRGANLASVTSADENKFVARLISDAPPRYIRHLVYFGLKRTGGRWKWTDGSPLSYTNWAPGEPGKNIWGKTGHCGNMYSKDSSNFLLGAKGKKGQWNDHICSWELPYVCKTPK
ncbi:hypothetical protein Bbelb_398060 [Branchiostoma belcheri]|nr:hypothetical protein Bbelb_398060 [Branchiostoma belcheri]